MLTFEHQGCREFEYGPGSIAPLLPVFFDPEQIIARMDETAIDHAVLSVTIPGVDWLGAEDGEEVADASNNETAAIVARLLYRLPSRSTFLSGTVMRFRLLQTYAKSAFGMQERRSSPKTA